MGVPAIERPHEAQRAAEAERDFWLSNYDRLLNDHPEQFVAARGDEVVASAPDLIQLVALLEDRKIDVRSVSVRLVTAHPANLLL